MGDVPFHLKFVLKMTHMPLKKADFDQYVSIIRASEKVQISRIGSRPLAFQRPTDEVRTLPLTPQRVAQKANL